MTMTDDAGMKHSDFRLGMEFFTAGGRWRVTDIGSRTIIAIRVDPVETGQLDTKTGERTQRTMTEAEAQADGWLDGPPYAVAEVVFDEYAVDGCWSVDDGDDIITVGRPLPRLASATPAGDRRVHVVLRYPDGETVESNVDLAPTLTSKRIFASLREDDDLFATMRMTEDGTGLQFSELDSHGNTDLEISVDWIEHLIEQANDLADITAAVAALDTETFPSELVDRLLDEPARRLSIWREYRGMTLEALAEQAGISRSTSTQSKSPPRPAVSR